MNVYVSKKLDSHFDFLIPCWIFYVFVAAGYSCALANSFDFTEEILYNVTALFYSSKNYVKYCYMFYGSIFPFF